MIAPEVERAIAEQVKDKIFWPGAYTKFPKELHFQKRLHAGLGSAVHRVTVPEDRVSCSRKLLLILGMGTWCICEKDDASRGLTIITATGVFLHFAFAMETLEKKQPTRAFYSAYQTVVPEVVITTGGNSIEVTCGYLCPWEPFLVCNIWSIMCKLIIQVKRKRKNNKQKNAIRGRDSRWKKPGRSYSYWKSIALEGKQMAEYVCIFPVFLVYCGMFLLFCCSYCLFPQLKSSFL